MSAINPIIFTLKNPELPLKQSKELKLSEKPDCIVEIPAQLLQRAVQACDTKTELVVYLTILRFSLGFNRRSCTVSRRFLEKWTGIKNQNIGRGLEGLMQKGLIEKLPESNMKHGDSYKVVHCSEKLTTNYPVTRNQNESCQTNQCNQVESTRCTKDAINLIALRSQPDCEVQSERLRSAITLSAKNKKEDLEESSSVSEKIQTHIDSMPQAFQKRAEKQSLSVLLTRFSMSQIEESLDYLVKNGTSSGQKVLMPLKYLSTDSSMETILSASQKQTLEAQKKIIQIQNLSQEKARHQASEKERREREQISQDYFESTFPTREAQEKFISEFLEHRWRCKSIKPSASIARKLAISDWFRTYSREANQDRQGT